MNHSDLYQVLMETQEIVQASHGISTVTDFDDILADESAKRTYIEGMATGLPENEKEAFTLLAENTLEYLQENSIYGYAPYATLITPLLRKFWPAMSIKSAITVAPMDKPVIVKYFIRPYAKTYTGNMVELPEYNQNVSSGPQIPVTATVAVPSETDLLALVSLNADVASIEKPFRITKVTDGTNTVDVNIQADIDGKFSSAVTISGNTDVIQGEIDYLNGIVKLSSVHGIITGVTVDSFASLEQNTINTQIEFKTEKILFEAKSRKISASWSVEFEQDMSKLFNLKAQAEFVDLISNQIATEIDSEILTELFSIVQLQHPGAIDTFSRSLPANYALGEKSWYENIIPKLNSLSQIIHKDTNLGRGNVIIMNPVDAAILESTGRYYYASDEIGAGTEYTYSVGNLDKGKWRTIVTPVVPEGKMLILYKSDNERKAVYYYCPYIPVTLYPFPLGNKPSMTLMTRYAKAVVRPQGIAQLNITP